MALVMQDVFKTAAEIYLQAGLNALSGGVRRPVHADLVNLLSNLSGRPQADVAERVQALQAMGAPKVAFLSHLDFVDRVGALYSADERDFLRQMSERFERVRLGFSYFGLLSRHVRPFEALKVTARQPRTGWLRLQMPDGFVQSVMDHHQSGEKLAEILFANDPQLTMIKSVFRYHDIGEAVIGDFTPHDPISKDDKIRLEELAVRLITGRRKGVEINPLAEAMERSFRIYEGFEPGYDDVRIKVRDIDLLEMSLEATVIRHACPPDSRAAINEGLAEFDAYVGPRLQTANAKTFFEGITDPTFYHAKPDQIWHSAMIRLSL